MAGKKMFPNDLAIDRITIVRTLKKPKPSLCEILRPARRTHPLAKIRFYSAISWTSS